MKELWKIIATAAVAPISIEVTAMKLNGNGAILTHRWRSTWPEERCC